MSLLVNPSRAVIAALALAATAAFGQTAPKPAAPADTTSGRTLGGTAAKGGPIMSKDELRACIQREGELQTMKTRVQQQGVALNEERNAIATESDALKAEKDKIEKGGKDTQDFNARIVAFEAAVKGWNDRVKQFNDTGTKARDAEEQKQKLVDEKAELDKTGAALERDRASLSSGLSQGATQFNERVNALNAKSADWNTRSKAQQEQENSYETERELWTSECGGRRYREDDEKAIRAGK